MKSLAERLSEPEKPAGQAALASAHPEAVASAATGLEPKALTVLRALLDSRFALRTLSGIAMDTHLSVPEVSAILGDLEKRGLAQLVQRPKGVRAVITAEGRQALLNEQPAKNEACGGTRQRS